MRKTRTVPVLGLALLLGGQLPALAMETIDLTLLGTTDVHGHVYPTTYFTEQDKALGLAKVHTLIKKLRSENPNTVLVDSGDMLQGTPLDNLHARSGRGANPLVLAMNAMKYDAFGVGNHDFNYGMPHLEQAAKEATFPFLSCNIYLKGTDKTYFKPYVIKEVGGVKVGVIGFSPPGIMLWDQAHLQGRLDIRDQVEAAKKWIPEMKQAGADVILAVPHTGLGGKYGPAYSGYSASSGLPPEQVGIEIAKACPQIDVLFAGHSHQDVPSEVVNGVACAQAQMWAQRLAIAKLHLEHVEGRWKVMSKTTDTLKVDGLAPDPDVLAATRTAHEETMAFVRSPIAQTSSVWQTQNSDLEDTPIMDLINRVQMEATGAQLASAAPFTRELVLKGPITIANVASLYPYENALMAIKITGKQLKQYLEHSARYYLSDVEGVIKFNPEIRAFNYDMVSGVDYRIDMSQPVGSRITGLSYQGQPVMEAQTFTMALNSFRQMGGGGYEMLKDCPVVYNKQEGIRELVIEYLKKRKTIEFSEVFKKNWLLVPVSAKK